MSPDELRTAAVKLTSPWAEDDDAVYASTDDREWWSSLRKGRDAARRLADVIEYAELRGDWIDRQYLAFAHGEAYSHEDRRER